MGAGEDAVVQADAASTVLIGLIHGHRSSRGSTVRHGGLGRISGYWARSLWCLPDQGRALRGSRISTYATRSATTMAVTVMHRRVTRARRIHGGTGVSCVQSSKSMAALVSSSLSFRATLGQMGDGAPAPRSRPLTPEGVRRHCSGRSPMYGDRRRATGTSVLPGPSRPSRVPFGRATAGDRSRCRRSREWCPRRALCGRRVCPAARRRSVQP